MRAYLLLETMITLLVLVIYWCDAGLVSPRQRLAANLSLEQERERQLAFSQSYLQSVCDEAISATVQPQSLQVVTSLDSYEVGFRNKAIYVKRTAYRYLTTDPIVVSALSFRVINSKLCQLDGVADNKPFSFQLVL